MLLAMVCCCGPAAAAETGGDGNETVDAATYCAIRAIRGKLQLRNETIAAMGCNESVAKGVFEALLAWYETKKTALATARKAKVKATRDLRLALQKIGMGKADDTLRKSIGTLKGALATATRQYADIIKTAITAVEAKLSTAHKTLWATARANAGVHGKYRHAPNLTAAQAKALHLARRTYSRKLAVAETADTRSSAATEYHTTEGNTLSADQKTAMAQAAANMRQNMPGVLKAQAEVLPLPDELKPPEPQIDPTEKAKP